MDLVAGAMGNLAPKLLQLLGDEYKLQKDVKKKVDSLARDLKATHVALCKVAEVPYDQLDPQVKLWASEAREASYDMEDILDTFLVRVEGCHQPTDADMGKVRRLVKKIGEKMFSLSKLKARRDIARAIDDIKKQVDEMTKRRDRYKVDDIVANSATTSIDPRVLMNLVTKASELVGIDEQQDALVNMLTNENEALLPQLKKRKRKVLTLGDDDAASDKGVKIVSVVGSGGLGKTTLAKVVYEKLAVEMNINYKAFVSVGQKPDLKKVLRDILLDLDKQQYMSQTNFTILDETQLIKEIQAFLKEKRYFIVIDDVWEVPSWNAIRTALKENYLGSKIMITSRSCDVAELVHCTYKIQPLCPDSSKILLYGRIFESQDRCPERFSELFDKILKKCGGVPLAIITIASLLANKSDDITQWQEVCSSIGSGLSSSNDMRNDMRKILSLSYYDLPRHMKTCFLYLSMYPEDYEIRRDGLIWRWISEGFIQPRKKEDGLFDLGKSYFNDLINRSLMQPDFDRYGEIYGCRVHDMILDLICSLSREENFVTTSDDIDQEMASESKKFRRISLEKTATWPKKGVSQVRSIAAFYPRIDSMPPFSCLDMLRVLDLDHCNLIHLGGSSKLSIGNLIHLRYLGLRGTGQDGLPGGIEKLQFLEVLSMGGSVKLPESIFRLRRLMCLEGVNCSPQPGNLLRNLASLQVLQRLRVEKDHVGTVKALGYLTQLTKLEIGIWSSGMVDPSIYDTFIDSLCNLGRLQSLQMYTVGLYSRFPWHRWTPPPHLSELEVKITTMLTLPKWISPASLPHLVHLFIEVFHAVGPEDIQILGTLPNLVVLWLGADYQNYLKQPLLKFVVSADAFPRLENCSFVNVAAVPSTFTRRAMPRVRYITFSLRARDFISEADGGLDFDDLAMDHLPSLKVVHCEATGYEEEEQMNTKLREAVEHAVEVHPNHPNIACYYTQKRI